MSIQELWMHKIPHRGFQRIHGRGGLGYHHRGEIQYQYPIYGYGMIGRGPKSNPTLNINKEGRPVSSILASLSSDSKSTVSKSTVSKSKVSKSTVSKSTVSKSKVSKPKVSKPITTNLTNQSIQEDFVNNRQLDDTSSSIQEDTIEDQNKDQNLINTEDDNNVDNSNEVKTDDNNVDDNNIDDNNEVKTDDNNIDDNNEVKTNDKTDQQTEVFIKDEILTKIPKEYFKEDKDGVSHPISDTEINRIYNSKISAFGKKQWNDLSEDEKTIHRTQKSFFESELFKNALNTDSEIKALTEIKDNIHLYNDNVSLTEERKAKAKEKSAKQKEEKEAEKQKTINTTKITKLEKELKSLNDEEVLKKELIKNKQASIESYLKKSKVNDNTIDKIKAKSEGDRTQNDKNALNAYNSLVKYENELTSITASKATKEAEIEDIKLKGVNIIEPYYEESMKDIIRFNEDYYNTIEPLYNNIINTNDEYRSYNDNIQSTIQSYFNDNDVSVPDGFKDTNINTYITNITNYRRSQFNDILTYINEKYPDNDNAKTYFTYKLNKLKIDPSDAFEDTHEYTDNMIKDILSTLDNDFRQDGIRQIIRINTNYAYNKQFERVSLYDEYKVYIDNGFEFKTPGETKDQEYTRKKRNEKSGAKDAIERYENEHYVWKSAGFAPYDNIIIVKYNDNTEMKYTLENKYYNTTGGFYQYDKSKGKFKTSTTTYNYILTENKELMNQFAKHILVMYNKSQRDYNKSNDAKYITERDYYKSLIDKFRSSNEQDKQDYLDEFNKTMRPMGINISSSKFPKPALDILNKKTGIASKKSITPESYFDYITKHEDLGKYSVVLNDSPDKYGYIKYIERYSQDKKVKDSKYKTEQSSDFGWELFNDSKLIFLVSYSDAIKGTNWTNEIHKYRYKGESMIRNAFEVLLPGRSAYGDKNKYGKSSTDSVVLTPNDMKSLRRIHRGTGIKNNKRKNKYKYI